VKAFVSTRIGSFSQGYHSSNNQGLHVNDNPCHVAKNRTQLPFSQNIQWLQQTHSIDCVKLEHLQDKPMHADASFTFKTHIGCAVMTADCLPILLCSTEGDFVAAVHAGWRGLHAGIINKLVIKSGVSVDKLSAWIGPAISSLHFEVGEEVADRFFNYPSALVPAKKANKYYLDLVHVAKRQLEQLGVNDVVCSDLCTYSETELFYSHRRASHNQQTPTGRMVSYILLT
jgi:YfiH family protein